MGFIRVEIRKPGILGAGPGILGAEAGVLVACEQALWVKESLQGSLW
jgi:hypothetical protein